MFYAAGTSAGSASGSANGSSNPFASAFSEHDGGDAVAEAYSPYHNNPEDFVQQQQPQPQPQQWATTTAATAAPMRRTVSTVSRSSNGSLNMRTIRKSTHKPRKGLNLEAAVAVATANTLMPSPAVSTAGLATLPGAAAAYGPGAEYATDAAGLTMHSSYFDVASLYAAQQQQQHQHQQQQTPTDALVYADAFQAQLHYQAVQQQQQQYQQQLLQQQQQQQQQAVMMQHQQHQHPMQHQMSHQSLHSLHSMHSLQSHHHLPNMNPSCLDLEPRTTIMFSPHTNSSPFSSPDLDCREDLWSPSAAASPAESHESSVASSVASCQPGGVNTMPLFVDGSSMQDMLSEDAVFAPFSQPPPQSVMPAAAAPAPVPSSSASTVPSKSRSNSESESARDDPLYKQGPNPEDGLYHCPWAGEGSCNHKPDKLKCNYDKFVDSHLKPYRCKHLSCENAQFSSTACLLRHEREAHAMHGHGNKPYRCPYAGCERAQPGSGFPRQWNLKDHMKRVHNDTTGVAAAAAASLALDGGDANGSKTRKRKKDEEAATNATSASLSASSSTTSLTDKAAAAAVADKATKVTKSSSSSSSSSTAAAKAAKTTAKAAKTAAKMAKAAAAAAAATTGTPYPSPPSSRKSSTSKGSTATTAATSKTAKTKAAADKEKQQLKQQQQLQQQLQQQQERQEQEQQRQQEQEQEQQQQQQQQLALQQTLSLWYEHKEALANTVMGFTHPGDAELQQRLQEAQQRLDAMNQVSASFLSAYSYMG